MSLATHDQRVAHDLACLHHGAATWVRPRENWIDVLIVGGGQSGLGAAFALQRERVTNILVLDENPAGFEGPWDTYARMRTLRTPKELTGIDLNVPSLTFRAWWEAQHGAESWAALGKIARGDWMDYLRWYRAVLNLPVRNEARVMLIEPQSPGFRVHLHGGEVLQARKVVLATGIQGGGGWHTPPEVAAKVSPSRRAHTSEAVDYARLRGKRVAILGGGASAFDNAAAALDAGVAQAHVFIRRAELPRVNPIRFMERAGLMPRYHALNDAEKYAVMASFFDRNQPPTTDMFEAAAGFAGFHLHTGSPWLDLAEGADGVTVTTPHGRFDYDFLVLSTGLVTDPALRPELAPFAEKIARWSDRFVPPAEIASPVISSHPYLGRGFELLAADPLDAPSLHGLFAFNYSALISHGLSASALSGLKFALPRLAGGVADQLFRDDAAEILGDYHDFDEIEFTSRWSPPTREAAA